MLTQVFSNKVITVFLSVWVVLLAAACSERGKPVRGFVLPAGDVAQGEQVVVYDNLYQGHQAAVHPAARFVQGDLSELGGVIGPQHKG